MADSLRELKKIDDEAEVILEQRRLQEDEVWKILGQHMEAWEAAERKMEPSQRKCEGCTKSSDTEGKILDQEWDSFMNLAKGAWVDNRHPGHGQALRSKR